MDAGMGVPEASECTQVWAPQSLQNGHRYGCLRAFRMDTGMGVSEPSEWTQVWASLRLRNAHRYGRPRAFRMDTGMGVSEPSEWTQLWVSRDRNGLEEALLPMFRPVIPLKR